MTRAARSSSCTRSARGSPPSGWRLAASPFTAANWIPVVAVWRCTGPPLDANRGGADGAVRLPGQAPGRHGPHPAHLRPGQEEAAPQVRDQGNGTCAIGVLRMAREHRGCPWLTLKGRRNRPRGGGPATAAAVHDCDAAHAGRPHHRGRCSGVGALHQVQVAGEPGACGARPSAPGACRIRPTLCAWPRVKGRSHSSWSSLRTTPCRAT